MCINHYLALERLGVVGCLYNTSILSRRPIAAIIPPPNPTTLTPASLSSQLLISLTTKMQFVLFCWLNCSGEAPSGLTASGSSSGEVKSEQPDDFLNDLLAQLDPPPGPTWGDLIFYSEHFPWYGTWSCTQLWRSWNNVGQDNLHSISITNYLQINQRSIVLTFNNQLFQRNILQ